MAPVGLVAHQPAVTARRAGSPFTPQVAQRLPVLVRAHDSLGPARRQGTWGVPVSLFFPFARLPPEGQTMHAAEEMCNPEESICKTPAETYESACCACSGTGWARGSSSHGRRGRLATCLVCHGIGYIRHTTTRAVPEPQTVMTLARGSAAPQKQPLKPAVVNTPAPEPIPVPAPAPAPRARAPEAAPKPGRAPAAQPPRVRAPAPPQHMPPHMPMPVPIPIPIPVSSPRLQTAN